VNSDPAFFSLATIPALQTLILDDNGILHIPKFQFGFEALTHLSLNGNKLESADDIGCLIDLEQLEDVSILGNPLLLRVAQISAARSAFAAAHIQLRCDSAPKAVKTTMVGPLRTIKTDPLALPSFTPAHIHALKERAKNGRPRGSDAKAKPAKDDVFMTSFASKTGEDYQMAVIEPTPLPEPEEPQISSVWSEVPVIGLEKRIAMSASKKPTFAAAVRRLDFLVNHPEMRLRPREATSLLPDEPEETEALPDLIAPLPVPPQRKRPEVAAKLAARTEYTKTEIQEMLRSMEERLHVVETDLIATDDSGLGAVEAALDLRNFTALHKQYEQIRTELINTLNP
jgi:hypothetical protein